MKATHQLKNVLSTLLILTPPWIFISGCGPSLTTNTSPPLVSAPLLPTTTAGIAQAGLVRLSQPMSSSYAGDLRIDVTTTGLLPDSITIQGAEFTRLSEIVTPGVASYGSNLESVLKKLDPIKEINATVANGSEVEVVSLVPQAKVGLIYQSNPTSVATIDMALLLATIQSDPKTAVNIANRTNQLLSSPGYVNAASLNPVPTEDNSDYVNKGTGKLNTFDMAAVLAVIQVGTDKTAIANRMNELLSAPGLVVAGDITVVPGQGIPGQLPSPSPSPTSVPVVRHQYTKTEGPNKNPLKGWNASWFTDKSESSVGFQYVAWKAFEPQNNVFDTAAIENIIKRDGSKGRHLVLRVYCQWIDEKTFADTACPSWLGTSPFNVPLLKGENDKTLVDFNHPKYVEQAVEMIKALGDNYDDDPRIFTIQIGVLGYWGEWHTSGFRQNGQGYSFTNQTTQSIMDAYKANFLNKRVAGRYPWSEPLKSAGWIGFHNDFFVANNGHSDSFDNSIASASKWLEGPIGGETPPNAQPGLYDGGKGLSMIEKGRYTTMAPGDYRRVPGEANYEDYMRLHRRMGYNFQIDEALFAVSEKRTATLPVVVKGTNIGVAPFYYDWDIEFALLDSAGVPTALIKSPAKLTSILPGSAFQFDGTLLLKDVAPNNYRLAVRLIQPGAAASKSQSWKLDARNVYIQFANDLTVVDAAWNAQNALVGGWSVLGQVTVTP